MGRSPDKGKGKRKEIAEKMSDPDIPHFLSPEQFRRLGYKSRFLANLIGSDADPGLYYELSFEKEIFGHTDKVQLTLRAIREYLMGDRLNAVVMLVWCM